MVENSYLGSNINLVKAHNLRAVLLSLLHESRLSRVQLAQKTNLSNTTITNLVAELVDQGILEEDALFISEEPRPVGRPRTGLHLVPNARYALAAHIGVGVVRVALTDLCAEMLESRIEAFDLHTPATEVLSRIISLSEEIIQAGQIERGRLIGMGVGASGLVNYQTGVNILAPNLGWRDVPIQTILETSLELPVTVDNNVRAMALGEAYFGEGRGATSLAFVYGRTGVGAGFVVDGRVFRGTNAGAGEIGHAIMMPDDGEPCRCGQKGCLETLVSEQVILRKAQVLAAQFPNGKLAQLFEQNGELRQIEIVFKAARQGDQDAIDIIDGVGCYLGIALANLVNIFNPELIILGGMFAQASDLILPQANRTMRQAAFAGLGEKVHLQTTSFGWRAGVVGAAALALMDFFYDRNR